MINKYLPQFIKKILLRILYYKEIRKTIKLLKDSMNEKRIIVFLTPSHGNLGDQCIALCEKNFLEDFFKEYKIIEILSTCWTCSKEKIVSYINPEECILIHGGGYLGSLWMLKGGEIGFREILQTFPKNKIVVFPQSVFFDNDEFGKTQLKISKPIYRQHSNLFICVRERNSYEYIKTNKLIRDMDQCFLMPDIVTYYKGKVSQYVRNDKILLCFRNDQEKIVDPDIKKSIENVLSELNFQFAYTDTVISHIVKPNKREKAVCKKMLEFAQCRLVITDRLHGMLLAAITNTPCLFMDNCSKKVSGSYEWIKNLEYIKPLSDIEYLKTFVHQILTDQIYKYDNKHLDIYYKQLSEIIRNKLLSKYE